MKGEGKHSLMRPLLKGEFELGCAGNYCVWQLGETVASAPHCSASNISDIGNSLSGAGLWPVDNPSLRNVVCMHYS